MDSAGTAITSAAIGLGTESNTWPSLYWSITGWEAPESYSESDGYKVTAWLGWAGNVPTTNEALHGTCVEYVDDNNRPMKSDDEEAGAPALCHFVVNSTGSPTALDTTFGRKLGMLSHAQWGGGWGATVTWSALGVAPGTEPSVGTYGVTYMPPNETLAHTIATTFKQYYQWWQPEEAMDYESGLRRYSKDDKVVGWHLVSAAASANPLVFYPCWNGGTGSGVITLKSASALAASAGALLTALIHN